jgi:hypothetical protein
MKSTRNEKSLVPLFSFLVKRINISEKGTLRMQTIRISV